MVSKGKERARKLDSIHTLLREIHSVGVMRAPDRVWDMLIALPQGI